MTRLETRQVRLPHIDFLKVLAANGIVLHHLAAYGPISDVMEARLPELMGWLYEYARMAVQVFLVIGGYLAVQGLRPQGDALPLDVIVRRYRRLVLPYLVAIMLAVLAAWLARHWMNDEAIPAAPELPQALAHVFLLQGLLGYDSLSAGVWYIALDFQLFVVMTLLLWLGRKTGDVRVGRWLVVALLVASLFHFNRDESWDDWAWYFFGAYGLGAVAAWSAAGARPMLKLGLMALVVLLALALDYRERLVLALCTALVLGVMHGKVILIGRRFAPLADSMAALGKRSYSLFLVNFPIVLLGNALYGRFGHGDSSVAAAGFVACWAANLMAAHYFYRQVESPLGTR